MTITLPDEMRPELERRAAGYGFAKVDDYIAWVVREDLADPVHTAEDLGFRSEDELEAFVQASIDSGPPIVADAAFWADLRREVAERIARGKSA